MSKGWLVGICSCLLFVWFVFQYTRDTHKDFTDVEHVVSIGNKSISVEIADTPEERERGLSGRDALESDTGMWFVFEESGQYGFWMYNMRFPIDIIWVADDFTVVGIEENVSPESYPEVFRPSKPIQYVLETSANFASQYGIKVGDQVTVKKHSQEF